MSEFGLLAGQAWFHHREDYFWVMADDEVDWPCRAYWSRSPRAARQRADLALELGGRPE
jgi:hypothetical protein